MGSATGNHQINFRNKGRFDIPTETVVTPIVARECKGGGELLCFPAVEVADGPATELFTKVAVLNWEISSLTNSAPKRSSPPTGSFSAARESRPMCFGEKVLEKDLDDDAELEDKSES
ncbi:hypothetical protein DAPPUDRAFT_107523 [Daphnia pulex]|uniref:Uncharacterized protein n=1 Tax=Daphnia pulex TaxID=6669 RepID=E9GXD5_DAPPU|nr:hypothetical protein DAPPUDRAFT_107523 [Daphnia pulex]|eukprot:EFX75850.1 hypothetical protein DAPPUDRAFT_107523 [Daphnia pulex]